MCGTKHETPKRGWQDSMVSGGVKTCAMSQHSASADHAVTAGKGTNFHCTPYGRATGEDVSMLHSWQGYAMEHITHVCSRPTLMQCSCRDIHNSYATQLRLIAMHVWLCPQGEGNRGGRWRGTGTKPTTWAHTSW